MLRVGWFSTARGESSRKLLEAITLSMRNNELNIDIPFVFCSREPGESEKTDLFINQVNQYNIPLKYLSVKKFAEKHKSPISVQSNSIPEWRLEYDRTVLDILKGFDVDICLLAGYMLIVGEEMCMHYNMLNLHPALPNGPKGTWQEVICELIANHAKESGVMMHLVTPELDRGPVITYCRYLISGAGFDELRQNDQDARLIHHNIENTELFKAIRQAGFIRETPLIIHTLKAFSEGSIRINNERKLISSDDDLISGYDLSEIIDESISKLSY